MISRLKRRTGTDGSYGAGCLAFLLVASCALACLLAVAVPPSPAFAAQKGGNYEGAATRLTAQPMLASIVDAESPVSAMRPTAQALRASSLDGEGLVAGKRFTAKATLTNAQGSISQVDCGFAVVDAASLTCEVVGDGEYSGARAVDTALSGTITIPETVECEGLALKVVRVGDYAFGGLSRASCSKLVGVQLPATVSAIGTYAFANCTALTVPPLPSKLASIGDHAFYNCTTIGPTVVIPASVRTIASYAFCRDAGIQTVEFAGDVPEVGQYAFTGPDVRIRQVVFRGASRTFQKGIYFNSVLEDEPTFYYTIRFFPSEDAMRMNIMCIGTAVVPGSVQYRKVEVMLNDQRVLFDGSVPEWPDGTNIWRFENGAGRGAKVDMSTRFYAEWSDYRDLSRAKVTDAEDRKVDGEPAWDLSYTALEAAPGIHVADTEGNELDETDLNFAYSRKNAAGEWAPTDDLVNPGVVRATITPKQGSRYTGQTGDEFTIWLGEGSTFRYDVDYVAPDGTASREPCWFRVTSMGGKPTVAVSEGNWQGRFTYVTSMGYLRSLYPRAVVATLDGSLTVPDTVQLFGNTFAVTSMDLSAFGFDRRPDVMENLACRLNGISLPAGLASVGDDAFRGCSALARVEFRGNMARASFGQNVFADASSISEVVWRDKKSDDPYIFSTALTHAAAAPEHFYSVVFYASQADIGKAAPIGRMTIDDSLQLAFLETAVDRASGLYDGALAAFPPGFTDDGYWFAPAWRFVDAAPDNIVALRSTLSDSTDAYPIQLNDAYTFDDVIVRGIADGQEFEYTGKPVIDATALDVADGNGRLLKHNVDYTVSFQRRGLYSETVWEDTANLTEPGDIRVTISAAGAYSGQARFTITVKAPEVNIGYEFAAQVQVVAPDGTVGNVPCTFTVDSTSADYPCVALGSRSNPGVAIDETTAGRVVVPQRIRHGNTYYNVASLAAYAFSGCSNVTAVDLPEGLVDIGQWAFSASGIEQMDMPETVAHLGYGVFSSCRQLKSASVSGMTKLFDTDNVGYVFNGCVALERVQLRGCTVIPFGAFNHCDALRELSIEADASPFATLTIETNAFSYTPALTRLVLPANTASVNVNAFNAPKTVAFAPGTTAIAANVLYNNRFVTGIELPDGLKEIGTSAFYGTAIGEIELPASLESVGAGAFSNCASLARVAFCGNADAVAINVSCFSSSRAIKQVVYRAGALASPRSVFVASRPDYFATVRFYENEQAAAAGFVGRGIDGATAESPEGDGRIGAVSVKLDTLFKAIDSRTVKESDIAEGSIPDYPGDANVWEFAGNPSMNAKLAGGLHAFAKKVDLMALENGRIVVPEGFKYSGTPRDPMAESYAWCEDAKGNYLMVDQHITYSFQRKPEPGGAWEGTDDLVSRGRVQITAVAIAGSGYTGSCRADYAIGDYLPGEMFTEDDANGHAVSYRVVTMPGADGPGTVKVGGGTRSLSAVDALCEGDVVIPDVARDPSGFGYEPIEIADYAFYRRMGVTGIRIPASVGRIGVDAFAYDHEKTDVKLSELATLDFGRDMNDLNIAAGAFRGCDEIQTIVYRGKKGSFADFGGSSGYQEYYTARFYMSDQDKADGKVAAEIAMKKGSYPFSLSETDKYPGSGVVPEIDEDLFEWYYEPGTTDAEDTAIDSMYVVCRSRSLDMLAVPVQVLGPAGDAREVVCAFTKLKDGDEYNGLAMVGTGRDGVPAVSVAVDGTLVVPPVVADRDGVEYQVVQVGAYAFGSSDPASAAEVARVSLPASVADIAQGAFENCTALQEVQFEGQSALASIGGAAFARCSGLGSIQLPEGLATIGASAFADSGLVRVRVPWSVSSLGKRAFSGCASLREAVLGGAMSLCLPAPQGAPDAWAALAQAGDPQVAAAGSAGSADGAVGAASNASALEVLDDYLFAQCPLLQRVVFDADMSNVFVSGTAFEGDAALAAVVFGDKRLSADARFGDSSPAVYHAISYFADADALSALDRSHYLVLRDGAVPAQRGAADVYAGAYANPPAHWEWIYDGSFDAALRDSMRAYARKIRYALDVSSVDGVFDVAFTVDGVATTWGCYGDVVQVSVATQGIVEFLGMRFTDTATGEVLLETRNGVARGSFAMPEHAVRMEVDCSLPLRIYHERVLTGRTTAATLALADMKKAGESRPALTYSRWGEGGSALLDRTDCYVPLDQLLAARGVRFAAGDSIVFMNGDTLLGSLSYDELYGQKRFAYPELARLGDGGRAEVVPVVAVRSDALTSDDIALGAQQRPSMKQAYKLLVGQTEAEAQGRLSANGLLVEGFTSITVVEGPVPIADMSFAGIGSSYIYNGSPIEPKPTVTNASYGTLKRGVDYELYYEGSKAAGTATCTVAGIGNFKGEKKISYRILRTQSVSGANAYETAAQAALQAYPNGSNGVVVASGAAYYDGLAAASLAGALNYPLLFVKKKSVPSMTRDAIAALKGSKERFYIVIVGSDKSVSPKVEKALRTLVGGKKAFVSRIGGANRYRTAYLAWKYGHNYDRGSRWRSTAIVVSGKSAYGATAASSYAAWAHAPVFACKGKKMDALSLKALKTGGFSRVVVVGNKKDVSAKAKRQIGKVVGSKKVKRIGGKNRYAISLNMAKWAMGQGMGVSSATIVPGTSFMAGMAGGVLAARDGSVVLLASKKNGAALAALSQGAGKMHTLRFVGNKKQIPTATRKLALKNAGWKGAFPLYAS